MQYKETKPFPSLAPYIHCYWELKGEETDHQWERNFPDGCGGLVMNIGDDCTTDNGKLMMAFGKTYVVGAMTSFKDSLICRNTHLAGVCLKPAALSNFYRHAPLHEFTNQTVELGRADSFDLSRLPVALPSYFDQFFYARSKNQHHHIQPVIDDIHRSKGSLSIRELSRRHFITPRQLERNFQTLIGVSPKEYANITRFQHVLQTIKGQNKEQSFADIAFECGFYDHAHLTHEIKKHTGLVPSQL